jgi:hypothetical protein
MFAELRPEDEKRDKTNKIRPGAARETTVKER